MIADTTEQPASVSSTDALGRVLAAGIEAIAREVARDEGRRAALEVIDETSAGPPSPEWVTQTKAAAMAGSTPQTIRSWLRAGYLGEPGRNGRVNVPRLKAYLANDTNRDARAGRARKIADAVLRAQR